MATTNLAVIQSNPIKSNPFYAIPKTIADSGALTDAEQLLMIRIYSAFGNDGWIEFKIETLAKLMNKGKSSIRRLIDSLKKKKYIATQSTGRALKFWILDRSTSAQNRALDKPRISVVECSKPVNSSAQKRALSLSSRKESLKEQKPPAKLAPVPPPKVSICDAGSFENLQPLTPDNYDENSIAKYQQAAIKFKKSMQPIIGNSVTALKIQQGLEKYGWKKLKWIEQKSLAGSAIHPYRYFCGLIKNCDFGEYEREKTIQCESLEIKKQKQANADMNKLSEILRGILT